MSTRTDHLIERAAARLRNDKPLRELAHRSAAASQPEVVDFTRDSPPAPAAAGPVHAVAVGPAFPTGSTEIGSLADRAQPAPPELTLAVLERVGLVVGRSTRTRISEEFRIAAGRMARAAVQPAADGTRNPVILVTSAKPGEGKTFISLTLAAVLAQNGPRPVVLVDADFKRDSMTDLLEIGGRLGLHDLLGPKAVDPVDLLVTTEVPGLSVLPSGTIAHDDLGNGFGQPLGQRVALLARALPDHLIVIDSPPCLATSDASTLAGHAGQVLMVVQAGRTQRAEVEAALDFVRACPAVTMLLNKVRQSNRQTFGSYDYHSSYQ